MLGRVDRSLFRLAQDLAGQRVERLDAFHFIAKEVDADREIFVCGEDRE